MQERRKYIRYDVEGSVVFKRGDGVLRDIKGDLINIGFQGMSVYVPEKISEGTVIKFELALRLYEKPILGDCKIIYVEEIKRYDRNIFRMGVEFMHIDKEAIQYILLRIQEDICAEARKKGRHG